MQNPFTTAHINSLIPKLAKIKNPNEKVPQFISGAHSKNCLLA